MAVYKIKINERTKEGRRLVGLLRSSKAVDAIKGGEPDYDLEEALEDVRKGRVFEAKDADDLIRQCLE